MRRNYLFLRTILAAGLLVAPSASVPAEVEPAPLSVQGEGWHPESSALMFGRTTSPLYLRQDVTLADVETALLEGPDKRGRRSDTYHLLAYQVATVGVLYLMPESVTGWTDEDKKSYDFSKWWNNVTNPQWDSDDFYLNYILHPYWGGAYYVRSRERGYDRRSSFWYSAGMSAAFEFGIEALAEEPSIQDIIVTPVGGWFVGNYFMRVRERIEKRYYGSSDMPFRDRFVMVMTDPLGALNRTVDGWFGKEHDLSIQPHIYDRMARRASGSGQETPERLERVYEIRFEYRW